jgi:hypothetical protein
MSDTIQWQPHPTQRPEDFRARGTPWMNKKREPKPRKPQPPRRGRVIGAKQANAALKEEERALALLELRSGETAKANKNMFYVQK